ncbi:MAG: DedA family protein [Euryarchaeota archaeon]|nr:DedA family protein [Euryarchaeota archaeon]
MTALSDLVEWGIDLVIDGIARLGYGGIVLFMALESACIPIPSEVIMPLAGNLAYHGTLDFTGVVLAGSLGSMLGSLAAYYAGLRLGRPFIKRYGKYLLMREEDLERAERWFARYGGKATFLARMLPVVRTFISFPAGIGRMEIRTFTLYSFVGSIPWCALMAYLGYVLGDGWRVIFDDYGHYVDYAIVAAIVGIIAYLLYKRRKRGGPSAAR